MSALKLDDLRKGADAKYPDFEVEAEDGKVLGFRPLFRMDKRKRKAVAEAMNIQKRIEELPEGHDMDQPQLMIEIFCEALKAAERTPGDFAALKKWAGTEDLGIWLFLFTEYSEKTNLGEASPSES